MKKPNLKSNKLSIVNDTPEPTPKQKIEAIAPSKNGKKSNKKTVPEEELVHNALQDLKEGIVQKPKDYIYSDEEKRKIKERKKEAPKTGSRIYSIPNQEQMQGAPTNKLTGQIPNTVNVYGAHYPVVRVLNDGNTILLHTSDYGQSGKTTQLVGKVKNDLPNVFPNAKVIEIHHPDYKHSAKVMRIRDEQNVHKYLEDASQNHPDENYRQHALESLEHLRGIKKAEYSKPIHAKRTEGEGWDYDKNVQGRLDRLHRYLSKVGLTVDLDSEDGRKIGATSPSSIGINKEGDPHDQQILHEASHAMLAPEGKTLGAYQAFIGKPGNDAKIQASAHREKMQVIHGGGMPEQTAQHMEAGIARRAGIEPFRTPKRGVGAGTAEEMSRKHASRILDLHDEGILSVDPFTGEKEIGSGIDALINAKARAQKSGEKAEMNRNPEDFPSTLNRRQLKSSLKDNAKYTEQNTKYRGDIQPRLDTVAFQEADLRDKIREKFKQHIGGHQELEDSLAASEKDYVAKSIVDEMFEVLVKGSSEKKIHSFKKQIEVKKVHPAKTPHILFSTENPVFPESNSLKMNHNQVLTALKKRGMNVHEVEGKYGKPEKSLMVLNPNKKQRSFVQDIARRLGQESIIHSDGKNHTADYLNGENAGKYSKGQGTVFHKEQPENYFTKMKDGSLFTHNIDFDTVYPKNMEKSESDLKKMSAPRITLPNQKDVSSRPDQEVYPMDMWSKKSKPSKYQDYGGGSSYENVPYKKIDVAVRNDEFNPIPRDETRGREMFDQLKQKNSSGLKGVFIGNKKGDKRVAFAGRGTGDYVKEHEGLHHVLNQVRKKYGDEAHSNLVNSLVDKIHPMTKKYIEKTLLNNRSYANMSDRGLDHIFKEEMIAMNRDITTSSPRREAFKHFILGSQPTEFDHQNFRDHDSWAKKSWKNMVDHTRNYDFKNKVEDDKLAASEDMYSMDLKKGSLQRKNPFNPRSKENSATQSQQRSWSHDQTDSARDPIPKMEGSAKLRALNKLAAKTHVRKDPSTGERLFLMHRGMGVEELKGSNNDGTAQYEKGAKTSWTPDKNVGIDFGDTYGGGVVSAWVPESALVHSINQFNSPSKESVDSAKEFNKKSAKISQSSSDKNPIKIQKQTNRSVTEREEQEWVVEHNQPFQHAHPRFMARITEDKALASGPLPRDPKERTNYRAEAGVGQMTDVRNLEGDDRKQVHDNSISTKGLIGSKEKKYSFPKKSTTFAEDDLAASESDKVMTEEALPKVKKPFKSKSQRRFAYANPEKFGGKKGIKEWESKTPSAIPESVEKKDKLKGGLADKKKPSDFNQSQLKAGAKVEREHTKNKSIAREIAQDHLTEDKNYYKKLKTIEKMEIPKPIKAGMLVTAIASAGHQMMDESRVKPQSREVASREQVARPQDIAYESAYNEGMKIRYVNDFKNKPSRTVIKETIKRHPDLSESHGYMLKLGPNAFKEVVQHNEPLVKEVGSRYYDHLHKVFGGDQDKIDRAWSGSVKGAKEYVPDTK